MKRLVLLAVWLSIFCIASTAFAVRQTYYVRPDDYASGTNDGSSYVNAWQGVLNVDFATYVEGNNVAAKVDRDDTLIVCGEHLQTQSSFSASSGSWGPPPSGEGTTEQDGGAIIIDGDCPEGTDGTLFNHHLPAYATWTDEGSNTYSMTIPGNGFWYFYYLQDIDSTHETFGTILEPVDSVAECQATPGTTYCASCTSGDTLYVHLTDNGNPDTGDRVALMLYGYGLPFLGGVDNIIIRNLNTTLFPQGSNFSGNNVTIQNNKILYSKNVIIRTNSDSFENLKVYENEMGYAGNGFYHINTSDTANVNGIHIRGNYIHHIGDKYYTYSAADSHAVAFQGGASNAIIEQNYVYMAGWALMVYVYDDQDFTNSVWRWNYIEECNDAVAGAAPRDLAGLGATGDNNALGDLSGNQWYGNVVKDCGIGFKTTFVDEVEFFNNTIMGDYTTGIQASKSVAVIDLINGTDDITDGVGVIGVTSGNAVRLNDISRITGISPNKSGMAAISKLTKIAFTSGSVELFPNDSLVGTVSGHGCTVRTKYVTGGDWGLGTAEGFFYANCGSALPPFVADEVFESGANPDVATYANSRTYGDVIPDEDLMLETEVVVATVDSTGTDTIGPNIKAWNNIFYSDGTGTLYDQVNYATSATRYSGKDFNYNIYYPDNQTGDYWGSRNWAEWQAYVTSGEANSQFADPLINSEGELQTGSPAIDAATTTIGYLLSPDTVWPSAPNTNGVIMGDADEIGAYLFLDAGEPLPAVINFNQPTGIVRFNQPTGAVNFNQGQ